MCGRFAIFSSKQGVINLFKILNKNAEVEKDFNVFPSQKASVIFKKDRKSDNLYMLRMKWGLVPHWVKNIDNKYISSNARIETVAEKPSFKDSFLRRRCIIPANGYYEWNKNKIPFYFQAETELVGLAAIYDIWQKDGEKLITFSILTHEANDSIKQIHHRQPLIVAPKNTNIWLDYQTQPKQIMQKLLQSEPTLAFHEVAKEVSNPQNNYESLIEKVS